MPESLALKGGLARSRTSGCAALESRFVGQPGGDRITGKRRKRGRKSALAEALYLPSTRSRPTLIRDWPRYFRTISLRASVRPCAVGYVLGKLEELSKRSQTVAEFAPLEAKRVARSLRRSRLLPSRFFNFLLFLRSFSSSLFALSLLPPIRGSVCQSCDVEQKRRRNGKVCVFIRLARVPCLTITARKSCAICRSNSSGAIERYSCIKVGRELPISDRHLYPEFESARG